MIAGWTAVEIVLPLERTPTESDLDVMSGVLLEVGAQGIETRDSTRPIVVVAAFPPEVESASLADDVREALEDAGLAFSHIAQRAYDPIDWSTHWRSHFRPLDFGKLWVVPSWLEAPPSAGHVLWLDPSRAFGTGLHATTSLCMIEVLERSPTSSMLDVGTGTGILALGALKLGTPKAIGVDNDPEALEVAEENARANGLYDRLELRSDIPDGQFPLVVANILANPLVMLANRLTDALAPGGALLLSGILGTQVDELLEAYLPLGLRRVNVKNQEEWALIHLEKPRL